MGKKSQEREADVSVSLVPTSNSSWEFPNNPALSVHQLLLLRDPLHTALRPLTLPFTPSVLLAADFLAFLNLEETGSYLADTSSS